MEISLPTLSIGALIVAITTYILAYRRSRNIANKTGGVHALHSLPSHYAVHSALWCVVPATIILILWITLHDKVILHYIVDENFSHLADKVRNFEILNNVKNAVNSEAIYQISNPDIQLAATQYNEIKNETLTTLSFYSFALVITLSIISLIKINPKLQARNKIEGFLKFVLAACSTLAIFTTVGIVLSVLIEALRFFQSVAFFDFIFGLEWSPQIAIREGQVGSTGSFGAVPLFVGTALISIIAMVVAVPIGLMTAIYLSEYASRKMRSVVKPLLEILAGIPTVVYGFFAAITVAPTIRSLGESYGLDVASESALAAGLVMGIMIIPFVSSISDDVINAVPQSMRDGSYSLGATQSETIKQVIVPAALPGIVGGVLLAISRAIGETMIVVMAAGLAANNTFNPLEAVTTVTVQIVTLLVGDQEFDSPKTLAAFALGLTLFVVTLILNVIALRVVRKYREQYE
ncbi:MAG: phosphate ABC transporter permease subunit PstC [Pseudomonadota bacterium]